MVKKLHIDGYLIVLLCVLGIVYGSTMNHSIGFTDSGELATVCYTLSIAHPTGYPLFTLLGRCISMIPSGMRLIVQLNALAVLLVISALVVFYYTIRNGIEKLEGKRKSEEWLIRSSAFIGVCILAFSSTVWSQSTNIEVYSLHFFFISLIMYGIQKAINSENQSEAIRYLLLTIYVVGLSFSNHMTTILVIPGLIYLLYKERKQWNIRRLNIVASIVLLFGISLSLYLYLPIRASQRPPLTWGNPTSIERFLWHVSGKQYRVWMFEGWDVAQHQLDRFGKNFHNEFFLPLLFFVGIGCVAMWKKKRSYFWFLLILFLSTIFYSVNYDIFDIEPYYLLAYLVVAYFCTIGLFVSLKFLMKQWKMPKVVLLIFGLLLPFAQWSYHKENVDESKNNAAELFAVKTMNELPPNAVVISGLWDYFISPSLYLQNVEKFRTDILAIDFHLLKNRVWYYEQLRNKAPWLAQKCDGSISQFMEELQKFEHNQPYVPAIIQQRWEKLLEDIVLKSLEEGRPVFVDVRVEGEFTRALQRVPWGMTVRIINSTDALQYRMMKYSLGNVQPKGIVGRDLMNYCQEMMRWTRRWCEIYPQAIAIEDK
jgi:hypothetical protein